MVRGRCASTGCRNELPVRQSVPPGKYAPGGIVRSTVATDGIAASVAKVGIIDAELGVIEDVEGFGPELDFAAFVNHKMFEHRHIEVQAGWDCSGNFVRHLQK